MATPDSGPPPAEASPPAAAAAETQPPASGGDAAGMAVEPAVSSADATPAPAPATDAPPPAAVDAAGATATDGVVLPAIRDMSLSALDIPVPSVASIGQKKAPTPPPTPPPEVVKEPAKHPPGVFSLYLTQDTALSIGLDRDDAKHESLHLVSAQNVFQDIKTRGSSSEFYPLKGQLQNYWEPNFTFRFINDDRYLNNDNFEIYATYDAREKLLAVPCKSTPFDCINRKPGAAARWNVDRLKTPPLTNFSQNKILPFRPSASWRIRALRLYSKGLETILDIIEVVVRYVDALQQNEVMDLYEDDFATFADEDYQLGDKTTTAITEYQSFSDITYGRSKMVSAVDWMPGRNGIVAAAISDSKSFDERMQIAGKPSDSYVLVWSFLDPIHPQMALESPSDVFSMRFNPVRPMLIAGGCYNGQVILWDLTAAQETVDRRHKRHLEDKSESGNKKTSEKAVLVLMSLLSSAKHSHSSIVSDIHWLPEDFQMSVKGQMVGNRGLTNFLASVSADGKVTFWDVTSKAEPELNPEWSDERKAAAVEGEKYKWKPVVEIVLASLDAVKQVGPLKMAIHGLAGGGTQFYCSTEFGDILSADVTSPSGDNIKSIAQCHYGPVRALLASPFFKTVLLSVGIWTFALLKDNVKEPIFVSRCAEGYLTTGCWSPTRPAVIYIGLIDGTIEVWDLLDHSHQPSMIATVCSCQLTVMEFWRISSPQFLAVGDIQGILHILEIPRSLRRTSYKEKVAMGNFFARQQAWVADVKNRSKEREKQIQKAMEQKAILKERAEQFYQLCTWTEEMETEYQAYENDCQVKFGAKSWLATPITV
ncbi:hypothetical protein R1flu_017935 [Riccia fluitans]|uniref:Uncharacterized protein n=1 Tax=Riccia fluitans TaxID=41844 RepID=A0ABD1ZFF1_9MARC